ncbi:MAG: Hpt domain-containing protein [Ginsengibacter sp.]
MENHPFVFDDRLDTEFLLSIYEGDAEHASLVFGQFLEMAPALMKEMEEYYNQGVVEPFRQKVHKLKPVFSFVGLTQLTAKAELLEKKCKETSQINEVSDIYTDLKYNYSENLPIIEKEVKRLNEQIN